MKLLFVGTHNGGGGTESHFVTLAKAMLAEGHEVAAVVRPNTPIQNGLLNSGVQLFDGVFRNAFDPRGTISVWKACGKFQPDWIIGSFSKEYWPLAIIARLRGVKLALFKHMDYPLKPATHYFIPRMAQRFIVISKFMRDNFIARGIDPKRVQILYNPLDLEYFKPDAQLRQSSRAHLGYSDDDIVVGFIGAMHPDKGMLPLCDAINQAMALMPNLKAIWVGDGLAVADLNAKILDGGYANRHIWHTWSKDVRPYYAAMNMLAVPTIGRETFGRVSIEAQAFGIPVLCSNNGGLPETFLPDVTGKLIPAGDVTAWREAILKMAGDEQMRNRLSEKGRDWVEEKFSSSAIAKKFTELLETSGSH
jgi:glycosyltransferase involved in cell wall biosynthesis